MINEKGKCYDCGKEGEGNLCTECFEKNHMINKKPEIKETIEGLEKIVNDPDWGNEIEGIIALSHAIKILQTVESAEGELPGKMKAGKENWDGKLVTEREEKMYNSLRDIARPILAKAKLRVEELEKEVEDTGGELSRAICKSAIAETELQSCKNKVEELEKEARRIRLGMGDDYGDDPVGVIDALKAELQSLKARELSKGELIKILRDNIDCEYHHRTQIKDTAQAIIDAREKKK